MQLDNPITINPGDYPEEYAEVVEILGGTLNDFMRQVVELSRANIDFDNLTSEIISFDVTVNETGAPTNALNLKVNKKATPNGFNVIAVRMDGKTYPTATPFISFTAKGNFNITIDNISGLKAGQKARITAIVY
jgi:hypothetical protein